MNNSITYIYYKKYFSNFVNVYNAIKTSSSFQWFFDKGEIVSKVNTA